MLLIISAQAFPPADWRCRIMYGYRITRTNPRVKNSVEYYEEECCSDNVLRFKVESRAKRKDLFWTTIELPITLKGLCWANVKLQ